MKPLLERLPRFVVQSTSMYGDVVGVFQGTKERPGGWNYFYLGEGRFVIGKVVEFQASDGRASIRLKDPAEGCQLTVGHAYPYLDDYWGERAALVLSPARHWRRVRFEVEDAIEIAGVTGGRMVGKAGQHDGASGRRIAGGWDHEHCAICWATIGPNHETHGYKAEESQWVCERCHAKHVVPKNLEFIREG